MRTVEVSRLVRATPDEVERVLSPGRLIEYEGTFAVEDVTETDEGWVVETRPAGRLLALRFVFEAREDGFEYRPEGEGQAGPFTELETGITFEPEGGGTRVTIRSSVGLRLPLPFADRIAAWKRRGELNRALSRIAAEVE